MVLSGEFTPYWRIMHGCSPLDGVYRKVTKVEGAIVYELDGQPVAQLLDSLAGQGWRSQRPVNYLTLGVNYGPRYEEPQEALYVNRLITGVLPNDAGIGMFEPDLKEGAEIQLMFRDTDKMLSSVRTNTETLLAQVEAQGKRPLLGLYIDCAGRTAEYLSTPTEEASIVQETLNRHEIPLLGMYSGVEIAPLLNQSRGLDWTGVLLLLATAK
jgi:small ligand-binding sensory domain FIST